MNFSPELIWFLVGLALVLSEFMLPGIILVFFGLGAWVTAVTSWIGLTPGWSSQLLTFAIASVVLLILLRRWFRNRFIGYVGDDHGLDDNIDEFKGANVLVTADIHPEHDNGAVEFKGARWKARSSSSIAANQRAEIVSVDGIALVVKPVNRNQED